MHEQNENINRDKQKLQKKNETEIQEKNIITELIVPQSELITDLTKQQNEPSNLKTSLLHLSSQRNKMTKE